MTKMRPRTRRPAAGMDPAMALCYAGVMGRQWLHAKRAVASMKKAQATGKIVREILVAAKMGGPDPEGNARLAAAVEKARKESVSREVIERAIKKGGGVGGEEIAYAVRVPPLEYQTVTVAAMPGYAAGWGFRRNWFAETDQT